MNRFGRLGLVLGFAAMAVLAISLLVVSRAGSDPTPAPPVRNDVVATAPPADLQTTIRGSTVASSTTSTSTTTIVTLPPTTVAVERPRTTAEATPLDPVPPGEVIEFTGVWDVAVTSVELDATDFVLALNDINPAPEAGYQYVLIELAGTYLGERTAEPVFEWTVSDGTTTYGPSIPGCGVIPNSIYDVLEVIPGESFTGAICVPVLSEGVDDGLTLTLQLVGDDPKYFDLQ